MPGEFDAAEWIRELRKRAHEQGNHITRLEGQMLADRLVGEERHRQVESTNREFKSALEAVSSLLTEQGRAMTEISQGQQSILQTMESDRQTRIETAAALEAAEKARRDRNAEPWVTPNRVIATVLGVAGVLAYANGQGFG